MSAPGPRPGDRSRSGGRVTAHGGPTGRRPAQRRSRGRSRNRSRGWCWALPTTTGWWLLALALALGLAGHVLGSRVAGAGLLTDAAILLGSVLAIALVTAWCTAALASPADAPLGPDEVPAGRTAAWALPTRALLDAPRVVSWRAAGTAPLSAPAGLSTPVLDGSARLGLDPQERGLLTVSARRLSVTEPLGLARGSRSLRASTETIVLPRPLTVPSEVLSAVVSRARSEGALAAPRSRGGAASGDLRPYRPGDPLATIHWRQSARTDSLLVTEREDEAGPRAVMALDTAPAAYRGRSDAHHHRTGPRTAARPPAGRGGSQVDEDPGTRGDDGPAGDRERAIRLASSLLAELTGSGVSVQLVVDGVPVDDVTARRILALLPRSDEDADARSGPTAGLATVGGDGAHGDVRVPGGPGEVVDLLITGVGGPSAGAAERCAALLVRVHDGALHLDEGTRP